VALSSPLLLFRIRQPGRILCKLLLKQKRVCEFVLLVGLVCWAWFEGVTESGLTSVGSGLTQQAVVDFAQKAPNLNLRCDMFLLIALVDRVMPLDIQEGHPRD
jgi:hypothetical protein